MRERDVHELAIGEYALDLTTEAGVDPVVVADMQKAAAEQILAEANDLLVAQPYVAVTGDMENG